MTAGQWPELAAVITGPITIKEGATPYSDSGRSPGGHGQNLSLSLYHCMEPLKIEEAGIFL